MSRCCCSPDCKWLDRTNFIIHSLMFYTISTGTLTRLVFPRFLSNPHLLSFPVCGWSSSSFSSVAVQLVATYWLDSDAVLMALQIIVGKTWYALALWFVLSKRALSRVIRHLPDGDRCLHCSAGRPQLTIVLVHIYSIPECTPRDAERTTKPRRE